MATFFYACDDGREEVLNERQIVGEPAAVAFEVRMVIPTPCVLRPF